MLLTTNLRYDSSYITLFLSATKAYVKWSLNQSISELLLDRLFVEEAH
jgi:hypothetical protein